MTKKCSGCGITLQNTDSELEGYTTNIEKDLCLRCFRIKNYSDYKVIDKDNLDFINILKSIDKTNDLVVLLVDLFNINKDITEITKYLHNDILLVFTKKDIFSYKIRDEKLMNSINIKCVDSIVVSSKKNYNFDSLYEKINEHKKSNNVYVVGYTNSGKSTLLNKLIYNYSEKDGNLTTSILPSTTLDTVEIKINDELTLIDTPGIIDSGNISNYVDPKTLLKIIPNQEIKPITYQVNKKQYILVENLLKIETGNNDLTLYFSNKLNIKRVYKDIDSNLVCHNILVDRYHDIVITGMGFIRSRKKENIKIYTLDGVDVYTRESLI